MILARLKNIYNDMKNEKASRCKIEFSYAKVDFDVIFKTDCTPFLLMFGVKRNNMYFEIEVKKGFVINPIFENDVYNLLIKLFEFSDEAWEPFKPKHFFSAFNEQIPNKWSNKNYYSPSQISRYYRNVEEANKIYFVGWIDHIDLKQKNKNYIGNVTPENLEKTKLLLSQQAYNRCRAENISSKWSDVPSRENLVQVNKYD